MVNLTPYIPGPAKIVETNVKTWLNTDSDIADPSSGVDLAVRIDWELRSRNGFGVSLDIHATEKGWKFVGTTDRADENGKGRHCSVGYLELTTGDFEVICERFYHSLGME